MQVSVIIPTYQPKAYLWQTLESLIGQIIDPKQFEIIIVLNGPRDPYLAKINEFIASVDERLPDTHPDIRLMYTETPGVSNARNCGIEAATGDFLTFVDDDDWVSATFLFDLLSKANPVKLPYNLSPQHGGVIVQSYVLNSKNDKFSESYLTRAYRRCAAFPTVNINTGRSLLSSSCCKLIPRSVIGDHRYVTNITHGEDALFMATISHRIHDIRLAPVEAIYYRRIHEHSAQQRKRNLWHHFGNTLKLLVRYTLLLLQFWRYNPKFIATRMAATVRRFFILRPADL